MKARGKLTVKAERWPWHPGYNWHGMKNSTAPLNQPREGDKAAARFGGGWKWCLGFRTGGRSKWGWTVYLELLFGSVRINWKTAYAIAEDQKRKAEMERQLESIRAAREVREASAKARAEAHHSKARDILTGDDIPF